MSFSSALKTELCRTVQKRTCCRKAECYGLLLFGRSFSQTAVSFVTGSSAVAHRTAQLTAETAGAIVDISASLVRGRNRAASYSLSVADANDRAAILSCFGHTGREVSLRLNRANLENDCCNGAFLRGVFLSCGTITDPQKDYHLEFVVPYMNLAKDLSTLIAEVYELGFQPGVMKRSGSYVVYLKGSERVADLLTFIGAGSAAMDLMQTKMLKEVRNNVNRKTNFETANLDKTALAAAAQMVAIEKILNTPRGIQILPEELQELAMLRYRNPEKSLRELGEALSEPLSRSGINHRLQRIVDFAQEL